MAFEGFPFNVGWEITLACNLRCDHCASSAGLTRPDELNTDEALALCDQFPDLLVQEVDLTGGEPLLRPDWELIANRLRDLNISVNLLTNGLAIGPQTVRKIREAGIKCVGISLDGGERTHDHIRRRKGSYAQVIRSIELLRAEAIAVIVITTVSDLNIAELPAMLSLFQSVGVRNWRLQPLIPIGRVISSEDLTMSVPAILELGNFIVSNTNAAAEKGTQIICSDGLEYIDGHMDPERPWRGCPGGWTTCGITSDGKVKACLSLPDDENLIEGDLRKNDLWDIWFADTAFEFTRNFNVKDLGPNCKSCDKVLECKGGCSANSYAATEKFHNDPYCHYKLHQIM